MAERKRAAEILRLTVEAAPNAMVMAAEKATSVSVNSQTEVLFGYRREEILGRAVDILRLRSIEASIRVSGGVHARPARAGARGSLGLRKRQRRVPHGDRAESHPHRKGNLGSQRYRREFTDASTLTIISARPRSSKAWVYWPVELLTI